MINAQLADRERRQSGLDGFAGRRGGPVASTDRCRMTDRARGQAWRLHTSHAGNDRACGNRGARCEDPGAIARPAEDAAVPPSRRGAALLRPRLQAAAVPILAFRSALLFLLRVSASHGSNCLGVFQNFNELFTKQAGLSISERDSCRF